ncbi:MAG: hypothetical protein M1835_000818 [Candelina submexicana]|nr:MAG: hypothetical protein M1835_000818 [Candelina submexicana]
MYFQCYRISIGLILLPSFLCSASPLAVIPVRSVVKRSYAFECGNDTIPYGAGQYEGFSSLTELCKGYPFGLGFFCHENGEKGVRAPLSIISRYVSQYAPEIIRNGCMKCGCFNGEPETPDVAEPDLVVPCTPDAEGAQAAPQANAQAPGTCQAPNEPAFWRTAGDPQAGSYPVNCAVNHGKPLIDDCDFARQIQEDRLLEIMGAAAHTIYYAEFMTVGAPRMHPQISSGASTFPITTPFTDIYGQYWANHYLGADV